MNYSCEKEKEFAVPTIYILDTVSVCKLLKSIVYGESSHSSIPEFLHNASLIIPMSIYYKIIDARELPFPIIDNNNYSLTSTELQRITDFLEKLYTDTTELSSTRNNSCTVYDTHGTFSLNFIFHTNVIGVFDTADYIKGFYPSSRIVILTDSITPLRGRCLDGYHFVSYDKFYAPVKPPYSSFDL